MQPLAALPMYFISKLKLVHSLTPICTQVRWKKNRKRKPTYLPTAPAKLFRIPNYPYVPPDEQDLIDELLEEYYRNVESLRKLFQEEIKRNSDDGNAILEMQQKEEENFRLLLEENKNENEKIRIIREEVLEKEFQENQLMFLQMDEERKRENEITKLKVEEIVRKEKKNSEGRITLENLDAAIDKAIDNPVNLNFTLSLDGTIKWEGKPSQEYEADIQMRVSKHKLDSV